MLQVPIKQQPDETTCGPTCLHAIYDFWKDPADLETVIREVHQFEEGGTLDVFLAIHALKRGYQATIYSYNLNIFDPTWFSLRMEAIRKKLSEQLLYKGDDKFRVATNAYIAFLELGGKLEFKDLRPSLVRGYLNKNQPVIAGLSATYLYQSAREYGPNMAYDDIRGEPSGHFVVIHGYDRESRSVYIADPLAKNPVAQSQFYRLPIGRVLNAILLGNMTYDANLILITPKP
jgi:hypothetical protein